MINKIEFSHLYGKKYVGGWEDEEDVFLWYNENGIRKVVTVPNVPKYFCISKSDFQKIPKSEWNHYKDRGYFTRGILKGNYAYFYVDSKLYKNNFNAWLTALDDKGITPLEGDVGRLQRLMIDLQLQVASPVDNGSAPKVAFYDIETDDRNEKIEVGKYPILSVAWKDGQTGEEFFLCSDADTEQAEKEFLIKVYKELIHYDVLVGYNNYNFDDPYIEERFRYYKIDITKWRRIATLDMFNLFERQGTFRKYDIRSKKLDNISKAILNRGKIAHDETIYALWDKNREKLKEYNLEDVRLIYEMEQITKSANLVLSVSSFAGLLHSIGYSPAKTVDTFLLRHAARRRENGGVDFRYRTSYYRPEHNSGGKFSAFTRNALPSDKRKDRKTILEEEFGIDYEPVQGALVLEAEPGFYQNVHSFDFNSLYPNTIRAFNIGHDTLVSESFTGTKNQAPNGVWYRTDISSGMSESVSFLIDERKRVRAQIPLEVDPIKKAALNVLQNAIKELTNSFYGVTAQYGGRYYSKDVAESITSSGRTFLPFGDEFMASRGHKVVIGDTDSLYISINDDTDPVKLMEEYLTSLREKLQRDYQVYKPEYLKMSYERKMDRVLIVAKKLYSAWVTMEDGKPIEPKLVTKGLMMLKGNYPKWATNICNTILKSLLSGEFLDADHYVRIVEKEKDRIANGDVDYKELLKSARIGRKLDEYLNENALPHVRIARRLVEKGLHIPVYSTISYLVTDGKSPITAVDESEITEETTYDACHYFNHELLSQLEDLLSPVFPEINWKDYRFPNNTKRKPFQIKPKVKI